jgi:FkbM family methyltransferase
VHPLKRAIRNLARRGGFDIVRVRRTDVGRDPFRDMQRFLAREKKPLILDIGANIGQSVDNFREAFPAATIHSFEPSPKTYAKLKEHCDSLPGVTTWNCGVGSRNATLALQESDRSVWTSFLTPDKGCWGKVVQTTEVPVVALDSFIEEQKIDFIHILKSDTQGFDFEVFKGAGQAMRDNRIGMIYFELIISHLYKDLPPYYDVFKYLSENDFVIVSFYDSLFRNGLAAQTDVLLISRQYYAKTQASAAPAAQEAARI